SPPTCWRSRPGACSRAQATAPGPNGRCPRRGCRCATRTMPAWARSSCATSTAGSRTGGLRRRGRRAALRLAGRVSDERPAARAQVAGPAAEAEEPGEPELQTPPSTWVLLRLGRFARPYRKQLIAGFLLTLASTAATLVPAYLTIPLMDDILIPFQNGQDRPVWKV